MCSWPKLPLRVDILLIRRESGELPEANRRDLSVPLPLFRRFAFLDFKTPTAEGRLADRAGPDGLLGTVDHLNGTE
jgi:hypothetical protein